MERIGEEQEREMSSRKRDKNMCKLITSYRIGIVHCFLAKSTLITYTIHENDTVCVLLCTVHNLPISGK
jgi:hypothetical protein